MPLQPNCCANGASSTELPNRVLSIIANECILVQAAWYVVGYIVIVTCVFMDIAGSTFILTTVMRQRSGSNLEEHLREPPQLGQAGIVHFFRVDTLPPLAEVRSWFPALSIQQRAASRQAQPRIRNSVAGP